jgi:hypothetical protein
LIKLKDDAGGLSKNADAAVDVLFSLRVNALQTPAEKRHAYVQQMIKGDILLITKGGAPAMVINLIAVPSHSLKQALSAILSILCGTGKGILYLTKDMQEMITIEKFVDILKDQDDNSVT